ncbi:MAG: hypothetical protein CFH22_01078 [Alphaproteobacteria bacterium MarineAlpha5_Bin12]|nr:MAG: hypothetical protein CFH22_01078 [Alphaproteobacteria bacterium MarineAlpha5_Bin12]|tara:strand:+ start:538 stop:1137 length:600 start_codon:yes stop_codon:yes gene_type:complete
MNKITKLIIVFSILFVGSCSSNKEKKDTSELWSKAMTTERIIKRSGTKLTSQKQRESGLTERDALNRLKTGGGLFGKKGISLSGVGDDQQVAAMGMPINPYLWRASLESISFMPLSSADPFGGIIITEWYNDEKNLNERCKVNIFIKGAELTTNNLKASIFCQQKESGSWIDTNVDNDKNIDFENAILEKAKKIRLSSQ